MSQACAATFDVADVLAEVDVVDDSDDGSAPDDSPADVSAAEDSADAPPDSDAGAEVAATIGVPEPSAIEP